MMIALYIKTHRKTGLKYLGKTTQDPFEYQGSGVRWNRHIAKHGYDVDTEVVRWCIDNDAVESWGIFYSDLFDVVNSPNWANLKREQGDGGWDHISNDANSHIRSSSHGLRMQQGLQEKIKNDKEYAKQYGNAVSQGLNAKSAIEKQQWADKIKQTRTANGNFGVTSHMNTVEMIDKKKKTFKKTGHQQGEKNNGYGTKWITNGEFNTRIPRSVPIPMGWQQTRIMGLPSLPKEEKELLISAVM